MYCSTGFIGHETTRGEVISGRWHKKVQSSRTSNSGNQVANLPKLRGRRSDGKALHMRDCLKDYLNSQTGSLPWQLDCVRRTK